MQEIDSLLGLLKPVLNFVSAISIAIITWMYRRITKLEDSLTEHRLDVAGNYVKQSAFDKFADTVQEQFNKQDVKLDKILDKLDSKADK